MVGVVGVVVFAGVARFFEHDRKCGAGATTEVEATRSGGKFCFQGVEEAAQKVTVAGVVGIVLMKIVAGFFFGGWKMILGRYEDQVALRAVQIVPVAVVAKGEWCRFFAKRAVGCVFLFNHRFGKFSIFLYEKRKF